MLRYTEFTSNECLPESRVGFSFVLLLFDSDFDCGPTALFLYIMHKYIYIYIYIYMNIYICIHVCIYVYVYVYIHEYMYTCIYTYVYMYLYIYIYICVYVHIYNVCICMYTVYM